MDKHKEFLSGRPAFWAFALLVLCAWGFSVLHVMLYGEALILLYSALVAVLITMFLLLVISIIKKHNRCTKDAIPVAVFLAVYSLVLAHSGWLKTLPEYQQIKDFQAQQTDWIYLLFMQQEGAREALAKLYLQAPAAMEKVGVGPNRRGVEFMATLLEQRIAAGEGARYAQEMYALAEAAFVYASFDLAGYWYEQAYRHGQQEAKARYKERLLLIYGSLEAAPEALLLDGFLNAPG